MLLNANNILNFVNLNGKGKKAQVGIDLTVCKITQMQQNAFIGKDNKDNNIPDYIIINPGKGIEKDKLIWRLSPGVYSLTFEQSIKLDEKHSAFIIPRSTILRAGGDIKSGVFDPGFESTIE